MNLWQSRRAEIERLYLHGEFSQADLAGLYGVSQPRMVQVLRKLGIPAKHQGRSGLGRLETPIRAHFIGLAMGIFTKPGWWNPAAPTGGEKRTVRGLGI